MFFLKWVVHGLLNSYEKFYDFLRNIIPLVFVSINDNAEQWISTADITEIELCVKLVYKIYSFMLPVQ